MKYDSEVPIIATIIIPFIQITLPMPEGFTGMFCRREDQRRKKLVNKLPWASMQNMNRDQRHT
jgi:hypothetical protein